MPDATTEPARLTRKGRATRDRIVEAATGLIAVAGVAGTSTEDVRRAAGVSGSQLSHYFGTKQALIRAVITRQADALPGPGEPTSRLLDTFDALEAWADAAVAFQEENNGRAGCTLGSLAGELAMSDEQARLDLNDGFLRWRGVLDSGLRAMRDRGELDDRADPDELALALLTALAGGNVLGQTMRESRPLRAGLNAALAYVASFMPSRASRPVRHAGARSPNR